MSKIKSFFVISIILIGTRSFAKDFPYVECHDKDARAKIVVKPNAVAEPNIEVTVDGKVFHYMTPIYQSVEVFPTRLAGYTHLTAKLGDGQYLSIVGGESHFFGSAAFNTPDPHEFLLECPLLREHKTDDLCSQPGCSLRLCGKCGIQPLATDAIGGM